MTINSFDQIRNVCKDLERVDMNIFKTLANPKSKGSVRNHAVKDLNQKVSRILSKVTDRGYLIGTEYVETYEDYCMNLAAYCIMNRDAKFIKDVLLVMESVLEFLTPAYKTELRSIKRSLKAEGSRVKSLGFDWNDLIGHFNSLAFAERYLSIKIEERPEPKVVVVEKVETVERVVERIVEKPVIIEKEAEDKEYFGVENHFTEFKVSFVVAPEGQKIQNQKVEICRKICGFLNADGGKLYIGVDDKTGRACPEKANGIYLGIWGDIRYNISSTMYGSSIRTIEEYIKFVKSEVAHILKRSNEGTSDFFVNQCIHVDRTKHDNVICIDVKPSKYCVVYLDGVAYQRDGEECKVMNEDQILVRNESRKRIGKEAELEQIIRKAIKNKKQVVLHRYRSANSNQIGDRKVEPYAFVCKNESVMCYDVDKQAVRQFKLSRIGGITVLNTGWKYADMHNEKRTDVFDWSYTGTEYHIRMDMSLKAMSNFCEMYTNVSSQDYYQIGDNAWRFDITVYSLEPAIGFYLSMAKEITIQESEHAAMFKQGVNDYVRQYVLS